MGSVDVFNSRELASLSNFATGFGFWTAEGAPPVRKWWPSAEHYFQAGKFEDAALQDRVRLAEEPGIAKALGRSLKPLRPDWDEIKRPRIRRAMLEKLWAHEEPRKALLGVPGGARIVNANPVDPYFGTGPDGAGQNVIGLELASLRELLGAFPRRRQLELRVADIQEPFQPFPLLVDVTGAPPSAVASMVAGTLALAEDAIESVELVTQGGFEKVPLGKFADARELEAFLADNQDDCILEVSFPNPARVTLWDGTNDQYLGATDLRYLCPSVRALEERLAALQPLLGYPCFRRGIKLTVDSDEAGTVDLDAASFPEALAAATEQADVVVSAFFEVLADAPLPRRPRPEDVGSPRVTCGCHTSLDAATVSDRVRGVVWGAALGDAVGLATEFMTKQQAAARYKEPRKLSPACRVDDKHRSRWAKGDWTDDTDQLVLLLDAAVAGGGIVDQGTFARTLKRWRAQGFPELGDVAGLGIGETVNAVLEHPAYDVAPEIAALATWRQSGCFLAANGAVMRCAGGALTYFWDEEVLAYNAVAGAGITHADPRCSASCVAVATLIARVLVGATLDSAERRIEEVAGAAQAAGRHLDGGDSDELWRHMSVGPDGLGSLALGTGGIGYTYKPLGAACWAFAHAESFKDAVIAITMEAGDADSNAAVAGAVLGARLGFSQLPRDWLAELPDAQVAWLQKKVSACLGLLGLPDE